MVLKRSAAASPPCSTSEVCFASRRPRSAAASPHGRVPFGGRPLGAAVSVPRGWRVFETQRWRAQSRRQKLRRRALKGAASEKGKSHAAAFSMPKSPLLGRYYNRRARSFRGEPPPHAAQMVGRSRGTPPTRPAAVRPWPPASASSVGRRSLGSPAAPSKIHGLGIFLGVFRG